MSGYDRDFDFDSSAITRKRPVPKRRSDPFEDMLRLAGSAAPFIGGGIGALAGGLPTGGIGAPPGAALGASLGAGAGAMLNEGAAMMGRDEVAEAERRKAEEEEQAAQHRMALEMLGRL